MQGKRAGKRWFGAGALAVSLPYLPLLFQSDQALLFRDLSAVQIPMRALWVRAVSELGRIPHWDPFHWAGAPYLSDPTQSPLYPLNALLLPFGAQGVARAIPFFVLLHHLALYVGAYLLLQRLRCRAAIARSGSSNNRSNSASVGSCRSKPNAPSCSPTRMFANDSAARSSKPRNNAAAIG